MRLKSLFLALTLLTFTGCGTICSIAPQLCQPSPVPTPTPTPTPAPPGSPVCDVAHTVDCWLWDGEEWGWLDCRAAGCPAGQTCEVGHADIWSCVTPLPPPDPTCATEDQLVASTCTDPLFSNAIKKATTKLGDLTGHDPNENLNALAAELRADLGVCVISGGEALFILRPDGRYDEYHAVYFGNGSWTNSGYGKYMGCHTVGVANACPGADPRGLNARFKLEPHGNIWDSTYQVEGREYCTLAGFTNRNWCPVRPEGNPDRITCERSVVGDQKWWCDGKPIDHLENPAQAFCKGKAKTCTEDLKTCAEKEW